MCACRVLILGGYGTFGGRLAKLLGDADGVELIIAGRSLTTARDFLAILPSGRGHSAAAIDRDADLVEQKAPLMPAKK